MSHEKANPSFIVLVALYTSFFWLFLYRSRKKHRGSSCVLSRTVRETHYLIAEDSTKILGRSFATYIVHWGDREEQDRLSLETNCVGYTAELDGDFDYAFRLRDELINVYGKPEAPELDEHTLDLAQATADDITALPNDGAAYSMWIYEGNEIILRVSADSTV